MIPTLLVFSLLLHFVTFYIIIVLFQRMNHLKNQPNVDTFDNLEVMLQDHLEAVRRENQALIESIDKNQGIVPKTKPKTTISFKDELTMQNPVNVIDKVTVPDVPKHLSIEPKVKVEAPAYTPPVEEIVDQVERSTASEVLLLLEKGYSSQDIAKKLNIGQGEVELMINLNRKRQ